MSATTNAIKAEQERRLHNTTTETELFELLNDTTQQSLQTEFVNDYLDADDRESAVFALINAHNEQSVIAARKRLDRQWRDFLDMKDLQAKYGDEIRRNAAAE